MAQNDINLVVGFDFNKLHGELNKMSSMMSQWGGQIRGAITSAFSFYAAYNGLKQTVTAMAEFQAEMSKLKALTGETGAGLERLRENALGLAGAFKAIEIAKAQTDLSRAGFSTKEINESIKAITLLATATGEDLPKSAEIAAATLRGFGLDSSQMTRVSDVMAASFNATALDLTRFGESMKYVAPNAKAVGVSLEETTAMLGVLSNAGIHGSMAGTALRRIFQDLSKDGRPVSERLAELGANGLSAADAMDEIGRIGSTALLILANSIPKIDELTTSLHNVKGATDTMATTMLDNLAGDWKKLAAAWDASIQKGTGLTATLRALTIAATAFVSNKDISAFFAGWFTQRNTDNMMRAGGSGADGPNLDPNSAFGRLVAGKRDLFMPDPGLFQPLKETIGLIPTLEKNIKELREEMEKTWDQTKIRDYATQIEKLKDVIEKLKEPVKEAGREIPENIKQIVRNHGANFGDISSMLLDTPAPGPGKGEGGGRDKAKLAAAERGKSVGMAFVMAFRSTIKHITDALVAAFSDKFSWAPVLDSLGSVAIELGTLIIGIGTGLQAIKEALENWAGNNPALAIAAGVALVGLGVAMKAGAASIASGGGGGGGGGGGSMPRYSDRDLTLNGEWRIRGADLVYVLDKQGYRSSVLGG